MIKGILFSAFVFAAHLAQADFQCVNNGFRHARLNIGADQVLIEDSYVAGADQLADAIKEGLGLNGALHVNQTTLVIPKQDANCDQPLTFLVSCKGQSKSAYVVVHGYVDNNNNMVGITLTVPVEVPDFDLKTNLAAQGPIDLGGGTTTVSLNQMDVKASAQLKVYSKDVTLNWNVFFRTTDDSNSSSSCQKQ